jgi:rsbT co-antagonist protein RsbR
MSADEAPRYPVIDEDAFDRIAQILIVMSDVANGDLSTRLPRDLPDDHPFGALFLAVNEMVESLQKEKERSAAYQTELEEKLATIERQRAAIRELSTPIMEVWDGVLCLPIVGVIDTTRSAEMTDSLLRAVVDKDVACTIIDITGIEVMDTRTADHFLRMAKAVRLLGARCVLTGINPNIAQTIVHMGVDLTGIETHRTLRDALQHYVHLGIARKSNGAREPEPAR